MFSGLQEMFSWEQEQEMFSWEQEMSHSREQEQEQEMFSWEQEMSHNREQEQEMFSWGQEMFSLEQQMSQQQIPTSLEQNTDLHINVAESLEEARKSEPPVASDEVASDEVCIPRVPRKLRRVNPSAFAPQIVSIGPYHRGKDVLKDMDIHKWRCFRRILIRNKHEPGLYFDSIREVVEDAKRCYEGNINLSIHEWVETMVLDGCFLLEILFGFSEGVTEGEGVKYFVEMGYSKKDPVYSERGPIEVIKEDMMKLENQLPLFILAQLLRLISNEENITDLVTEKVLKLFELQEKILEMKPEEFRSCSHCLDIYRRGLLRQFQAAPPAPAHPIAPPRSTIKKHRSTRQRETKHPANELREAGVKFKKRETDCFLDIKYMAGVLYIPRILLDGTMKNVIQNLIAFEQTYHPQDNHHEITSYAVFMDDLIDTSTNEAAYLHALGIIDPFEGKRYDDAAYFFNQITDGVIYGMYLQEATEGLLKKINDHNKSRIRKWMAGAKHRYFSNPWSIISLIAAIALLVLTFLQTFYGMYGYYRPRN